MKISNPLEELLGYNLRRASATMMLRLCNDYEKIGLKLTQATVLVVIDANPGAKQSDVGRILDIKSANMTPLIAVLDKRGFIERRKLDGRSQGLYLSKQGEEMIGQIWGYIRENEAWLASAISKIEKKGLIDHFKAIWQTK